MFSFIPPEIMEILLSAWKYVYMLMPIWLPIIFLNLLFKAWVDHAREKFWQKEGSLLLEIKLPKEITKSPLAMEVVLNAFFQAGGEGTWVDRLWKGQTRPWFSLELVSIGGKIHFYVWTRPKWRNVIESQMYSQYPGIEIYEVEDYSKDLYYEKGKTEVWGFDIALSKPDPYPIKTYIDYNLDRDPKEEFKIDPMTPMIEFLGSLTQGHIMCIQIIIRAHKKEQPKSLTWAERFDKLKWEDKTDAWQDEAKSEIERIVEQFRPADKEKQSRQATEGEKDTIAALERSVSKLPFDCGIRCIYVAPKDIFNGGYKGGATGSFKQYGSQNLNGFKPTGWFTIFDYPWQDYFGTQQESFKTKILEEYKSRQYFFSKDKDEKFYGKPIVLNTEELATIYHFPGAVANTPTFDRIPSKKSEAPANLPL